MDERCKCSFRIRMVGDGCRYCQPQTYIDHLEEIIADERAELAKLESENGALAMSCKRLLSDKAKRLAAHRRVSDLVTQMFTSGNSIPVERITLTRAQWESARQGANHEPHGTA